MGTLTDRMVYIDTAYPICFGIRAKIGRVPLSLFFYHDGRSTLSIKRFPSYIDSARPADPNEQQQNTPQERHRSSELKIPQGHPK
jgi:hypothetical protein